MILDIHYTVLYRQKYAFRNAIDYSQLIYSTSEIKVTLLWLTFLLWALIPGYTIPMTKLTDGTPLHWKIMIYKLRNFIWICMYIIGILPSYQQDEEIGGRRPDYLLNVARIYLPQIAPSSKYGLITHRYATKRNEITRIIHKMTAPIVVSSAGA